MNIYEYSPEGVCSNKMIFNIENNIIKNIKIIGGCPGNGLGISSLLKDLDIDEAIKRLEGIKCGFKPTSCPDQIAKALKEYKEKRD